MALGMIGAYGLLSNSVNERRKEIGVRMALGASPKSVLRWLIRQAVRLTVVGIAIGLLGALIATRFMTSFLYGVAPADGFSLILGSVLMSVTALVACYFPARRASRLDPMVTLRCE
jgi:ABC-type antimicrobial peptide transport system permease subunit